MRYNEFDDIHKLVEAMEKASDEYKWTSDTTLYKAIMYTGAICGSFDLILAESERPICGSIVVYTESRQPCFKHETHNTHFVLKDGLAEKGCNSYETED